MVTGMPKMPALPVTELRKYEYPAFSALEDLTIDQII
jgi:hypothetical protein